MNCLANINKIMWFFFYSHASKVRGKMLYLEELFWGDCLGNEWLPLISLGGWRFDPKVAQSALLHFECRMVCS